jgi:hypothetical protein
MPRSSQLGAADPQSHPLAELGCRSQWSQARITPSERLPTLANNVNINNDNRGFIDHMLHAE